MTAARALSAAGVCLVSATFATVGCNSDQNYKSAIVTFPTARLARSTTLGDTIYNMARTGASYAGYIAKRFLILQEKSLYILQSLNLHPC